MSVVRLYRMIPTGDTELLLASGPHRAVVHPWCFPEALFSRQGFSSMPDGGTGTINDAEVKVPATHYLELAETLTPTGRPASITVSPTWYETKPEFCTIPLRNPHTGQTVLVEMDGSFASFVLYTGDAIQETPRRALAIEPMTCASDSFNHPGMGLKSGCCPENFSVACIMSQPPACERLENVLLARRTVLCIVQHVKKALNLPTQARKEAPRSQRGLPATIRDCMFVCAGEFVSRG
jgi:hypothetical protein